MALITCEHVCLGYDGQTVLRDVNFTPLNTFCGIIALQERNEVYNYAHYKYGEKI